MSPPTPGTPAFQALASKHLARARQHYEAYKRLKAGSQDLDWSAIVLFYAALHLVQAYFAGTATTAFDIPRTHADRSTRIGLKLTPIYKHYRILEDLSKEARYEPDPVILTPEAIQEYEDRDFVPIVVELRKHGVNLLP
jgi:hypothetical protein